jgi:hypothetical protein
MFGPNISLAALKRLYHPYGTGGWAPSPVFAAAGIVNWWWCISRVIGDFVLSCPARRAARMLAAMNRTAYVYLFNHTPALSLNERSTALYGAFHGSEVPFVFYDTFELPNQSEVVLSAAMVQVRVVLFVTKCVM